MRHLSEACVDVHVELSSWHKDDIFVVTALWICTEGVWTILAFDEHFNGIIFECLVACTVVHREGYTLSDRAAELELVQVVIFGIVRKNGLAVDRLDIFDHGIE